MRKMDIEEDDLGRALVLKVTSEEYMGGSSHVKVGHHMLRWVMDEGWMSESNTQTLVSRTKLAA